MRLRQIARILDQAADKCTAGKPGWRLLLAKYQQEYNRYIVVNRKTWPRMTQYGAERALAQRIWVLYRI